MELFIECDFSKRMNSLNPSRPRKTGWETMNSSSFEKSALWLHFTDRSYCRAMLVSFITVRRSQHERTVQQVDDFLVA